MALHILWSLYVWSKRVLVCSVVFIESLLRVRDVIAAVGVHVPISIYVSSNIYARAVLFLTGISKYG